MKYPVYGTDANNTAIKTHIIERATKWLYKDTNYKKLNFSMKTPGDTLKSSKIMTSNNNNNNT